MKKVMHIVEAFGGGVFTFMVDLLNSITEEYDVILVCSIRPQTPNNYIDYLDKSIKIIELKNGGRNIGIKDFKLYFEIKEIIKRENPDIVHLHSSKAGFLGRLYCSDRKREIFYNPHGYSFFMKDAGKIKRFIYKGIELVASKKCGYIIACSKGEYEEALKLSKKVFLINNGININKLSNLKGKDVDIKNLKICTLGRISIQKDPKIFNEIAKKFSKIQFTWIGDGELINELNAPNIKITGWLEKEKALEIMNESDIFILTSLWEGLPIALLEAMYYKKICIVSNCIGNRDVINKENGFLCSSLEDYFDAIYKILEGKIDMKRLQDNAHKDVELKYNFTIVSRKYMSLYKLIGKEIKSQLVIKNNI